MAPADIGRRVGLLGRMHDTRPLRVDRWRDLHQWRVDARRARQWRRLELVLDGETGASLGLRERWMAAGW
jgi:hypothetical protein